MNQPTCRSGDDGRTLRGGGAVLPTVAKVGIASFAVCTVASGAGAAATDGSVEGPGPWLAWWWIGAGAVVLALVAWIAVRFRLAAARRRERELVTLVDRRTRELRSLGSLTEKINTAVGLEEVLEHVWESFRMVVPYNRIGFADLSDEGRRVRAVWARSDASEIRIGTGYSALLEDTSLGRILESGTPRIIGDLVDYLERHPQSEATRAIVEEGMRSSLTVPLAAMGHQVGFLFFSSQTPNAYTAEHTRLLERISGQLSLAIEKSRLYDRLLETTRELEEANRQLARAAATDSLTGLPNRRVFDERLALEWRRCRRSGRALSVLMIDIDHFKSFNDDHGHVAGDACLRAVAERLSSSIGRAADLLARYGGEEFAAILPETGNDEAARLAEELRNRVESLELPGTPASASITVSIGVATTVPDDERTPEDLIRRADASLYVAKQRGRNLVHSSTGLEIPKGFFESDA
jgi:diguanylate cyclase (GGDEF)-like protein